jgi:signal transduction histidine kinase
VRGRAKKLADRLVYGKRATPYEVLSQFSERMGGTYALDDILPRMARVLAEGTGGSAEIWLRVGEVLRSAAVWPDEGEPVASSPELGVLGEELPGFSGVSRATPVLHQSELLGAITVTKPPNDPIRPTEEKLVDDVASQAGLVLFNVRLIEELRASRQRLVKAQDEERRRIERNIHDGAQQQLVSLAVKLNLVDRTIDSDRVKGHEMLAELRVETQDALQDLRDLARGIYPPLLADKGLAVALDAQSRKSPVPVAVESAGIGRYPQEVEAAIYFWCLEALQNVAKYAEASTATVRLADSTGGLTFEVTDDGRGFDPSKISYGTGLQGMADRLEALGGSLEVRSLPAKGTTVIGRVPGWRA